MRRGRSGDGVTVVEAAFVLPVLFMLMFGLVDLGMWSFNVNQASNAARDGARAGILAYPLPGVEALDVEEARARDAVVAAVKSNLPEDTVDDDDITIECFADDGTSVACTGAAPERIRVGVEWHWDLVTPAAAVIGVDRGAARGDATMAIVGRPVAPPAPAPPPDDDDPVNPDPVEPCVITDLTGPTTVRTSGNQLAEPMEIRFTDNSEGCHDLRVVLTGTKATPDTYTHYCGCGEAPNHVWLYTGSNNIWYKNSGKQGKVAVMNGDDPVPLASYNFFLS